ncbi:MAG TPA: hypothetical protein VHW43_10980 [Puia sp.]|jgi:hypothetical protein|nr:hypothetical protein [Puia sp.]
MSKPVRTIVVVGGVVILYSFIVRIAGIYFFWESSFLGWTVLFIGLLLWLFRSMKIKKAAGKKRIGEKLGIAFLILALIVQLVVIIVFPRTDAYAAAVAYVKSNDSLKKDLGAIKGFGFTESGSIAVSSTDTSEAGNAELHLIVKGEKKYKDLTIDMVKDWNTPWEVQDIR